MADGIIYEGNISNTNTSEVLMAERINENFNRAIGVIVSKKLEDLAFDKNEICLVENIINKKNREYQVNNGSIKQKQELVKNMENGREFMSLFLIMIMRI